MPKSRSKRIAAAVIGVLLGIFALAACSSAATPASMCGWVIGNGESGREIGEPRLVYPGDSVEYDSTTHVARYVPCSSRNYIINDGSIQDVDGNKLGDRHTPIQAVTQDGTPVLVSANAQWTLNQAESALLRFIELCDKYECYTTEVVAGSSNFATPGWNGLLAENFGPSMERAFQLATREFPDEMWVNGGNIAMQEELGKRVSELFNDQIRFRTGFEVDLFCGSGNSGWSNPNANSTDEQGEFTCTSVRFGVDRMTAKNAADQQNLEQQSQEENRTESNQSRYNSSYPLYGNQTHYWLGVQDAVRACPQGATCNFNVREPSQG